MNNFGQPVYSFTPEALQLVGEARLAYVRKVYTYFLVAIGSAAFGTLLAFQSDLAISFARAPFIAIIALFGSVWFAGRSANNPSLAVPTLGVATFISGLVVAPTLYVIAHGYVRGMTVATIYDALLLSSSTFVGLTTYAWLSKKDFSYLYASLMIGFWMVLGVMIINMFVQSSSVDLGVSIIGAILFSGFILADTSRILRRAHEIPPTLAALNLYLDFLNLFMFILRILGGGRDRR
jgi:modulator of FtsH protease